MKITAVLVASASVLLFGCGGSDDGGGGSAQTELADLLVENEASFEEECVRDKTGELSDDDAQFLIDNFDATDMEGFSTDLEAWADSLIECIPGASQD
jgi:major membrane immunogen (membrane-anchored lipoprotein)